jgi:predicted secreted hydrolase
MRLRWLVAGAILPLLPAETQAQEWQLARPDYAWEFPRDHWSHPGYKTEWWYFTGQLVAEADTTRRFGYQFTFVRVGVTPMPLALASTWKMTDLVMGHLAITDPVSGRHWFAEVVWRANGVLGGFNPAPNPRIAWSRGPPGTAQAWELEWRNGGFVFRGSDARMGISLDLATQSRKPLGFQGPGGQVCGGGASNLVSEGHTCPVGRVFEFPSREDAMRAWELAKAKREVQQQYQVPGK